MEPIENTDRQQTRRFRASTLEYHGPADESPPVSEASGIQIAWFGPSDPDDHSHGDLWWSANLAIREANDEGGFEGKRFRLIPVWSDDPWGTGVSALFRAIYEQPIMAVLGSTDGASTHLAEQVVAKARLPLVSPVSTDKSVNLAGVPWMFSCAPSDDVIAEAMVSRLTKNLDGQVAKLVLLSATDHDSRLLSREIMKALSRRHLAPAFRFEFPSGRADLDNLIENLNEAAPNCVLVVAGLEDSAGVVRTIVKDGVEAPIFGTHHCGRWRFRDLAGESADGVRYPSMLTKEVNGTRRSKFARAFRSRYRREPDYAAMQSYDAARVLIEAILKAGPNRARIRRALTELSPWPGVCGLIEWDGTGRNIRVLDGER